MQIAGLLYFHRISDNRVAGSALRGLKYFEELCGEELNVVVFTTTMWDVVLEKTGVEREKELMDKYWKPILDLGSSVKRFRRTQTSAFEVLGPIFERINKRTPILPRRTLAKLKAKLEQSTGGRKLFEEIEELAALRQEKLDRMRKNPLATQTVSQSIMEDFEKGCLDIQWLMTIAQKVEPDTREVIETGRRFFE